MRLDDQSLLAEVAKTDSDSSVRRAATALLDPKQNKDLLGVLKAALRSEDRSNEASRLMGELRADRREARQRAANAIIMMVETEPRLFYDRWEEIAQVIGQRHCDGIHPCFGDHSDTGIGLFFPPKHTDF